MSQPTTLKADNIRDITEGKLVDDLVFVFDQLKEIGVKRNVPHPSDTFTEIWRSHEQPDNPEGR